MLKPPLAHGSARVESKEVGLARKSGSYKFEKRQKELKKQKKRQEKLLRKQKGDDDLEENGESAASEVKPPDQF